MTAVPDDRIRARLALVEEHVRRENAHDLSGIMATFGLGAHDDDEPWGEHHTGRDAVRRYYDDLLIALPELRIDVTRCLATEELASKCASAARTSDAGAVCLPPVDPSRLHCAESSASIKRESSPASASTTTEEACCAK